MMFIELVRKVRESETVAILKDYDTDEEMAQDNLYEFATNKQYEYFKECYVEEIDIKTKKKIIVTLRR